MALKEIQRKLIEEDQNWPKDSSVEIHRKTVSSRAPSSDMKCPMQIILFLGQDNHFISLIKVVLITVITHFLKLMLLFVGRVTWGKKILS